MRLLTGVLLHTAGQLWDSRLGLVIFLGVDLHVPGQMAGCSERLLTNTTLMRLLTGVNPHVDGQIAGSSEKLFTNTALIKVHTSVNPHVRDQTIGMSE